MEEIKRFFSKNNKEDFLNYMNLKIKLWKKILQFSLRLKQLKLKLIISNLKFTKIKQSFKNKRIIQRIN